MRLERDEFRVTYERATATPHSIIATIEETGFKARAVHGRAEQAVATRPQTQATAPSASTPAYITEALALARRDSKPVLLEFYAAWCVPCRRMEKETFQDPKVERVLDRFVVIRIDTDALPAVAQRYGVEALPDLRLF